MLRFWQKTITLKTFRNPWEQYITSAGGTPGKLSASGNVTVNCTWIADAAPDKDGNQRLNIPGTDTVFTPPYSYTLESADAAKVSVTSGAGSE